MIIKTMTKKRGQEAKKGREMGVELTQGDENDKNALHEVFKDKHKLLLKLISPKLYLKM